jgi:methionine transaminase
VKARLVIVRAELRREFIPTLHSMDFHSRLPETGTSIFAVMSKLALEYDAINLSQGFPDFAIDPALIGLVNRYMLEGYNQYAPMPGLPALREEIAKALHDSYGFRPSAEHEITITSGATEGIFATIAALVSQGDEVIILDPSYDSYDPAVRLNGGLPVHINLTFPDYSVDWQKVRDHVTPRTRMLIVNSPHNPSGAVFSGKDISAMEDLIERTGITIVSDEVYDRLIFDKTPHHSILSSPMLAAHCAAVFSFGKTFHATGWKCGYVVAPPHLTKEIRKTHQFIVFSVNTPVQSALAEYMKEPAHYRMLGAFYQQKRDFFLNRLKGSSFEPLPCRGSYFQLLSYRNVSDKPDVDMARELTIKSKVASIPVSVFYKDNTDHHILRFCFAKTEETLEKACDILRKF